MARLPDDKKTLHNKWIYKLKEEPNGNERYKAKPIVEEFQQKEGIDYTKIFFSVVKMTIIRTVLSIVVMENLYLENMNMKPTFLHGDLDEELYMKQS